jgi:hypothetical protein
MPGWMPTRRWDAAVTVRAARENRQRVERDSMGPLRSAQGTPTAVRRAHENFDQRRRFDRA